VTLQYSLFKLSSWRSWILVQVVPALAVIGLDETVTLAQDDPMKRRIRPVENASINTASGLRRSTLAG